MAIAVPGQRGDAVARTAASSPSSALATWRARARDVAPGVAVDVAFDPPRDDLGVAVVALGELDQRRDQQRLVCIRPSIGRLLCRCLRDRMRNAMWPSAAPCAASSCGRTHAEARSARRTAAAARTMARHETRRYAHDRRRCVPSTWRLRWRNRLLPRWARPSSPNCRPRRCPTRTGSAAATRCARELGLDAAWLAVGRGAGRPSPATRASPAREPLASVYSGHQFGVWAGQLGDGRAILLGEIDTPAGPHRAAAQGQRPARPTRAWATAARCCARSSASSCAREAMHALGIPTTRALCVTGSDAPVRREEVETAAVVTRVAPSFIRFGHFEHFARQRPARRTARAGRLRHRPLLPRLPRRPLRRQRLRGAARSGERAHRRADGAVAGGRLLPRRDEHRQHEHPRPHHRLRAVPVPRRLRSRATSATTATRRAATPTTSSPTSPTGTCSAWPRRCCR